MGPPGWGAINILYRSESAKQRHSFSQIPIHGNMTFQDVQEPENTLWIETKSWSSMLTRVKGLVLGGLHGVCTGVKVE